jgi:transposase
MFTMNDLTLEEKKKYTVIMDYINGKISRKQAAAKLGVSVVHISRLKKRYSKDGKQAFVHGNNYNQNAIRTKDNVEKSIVELYKTKFQDFNFKHFYEYISENGLLGKIIGETSKLSSSTVSRILTRNGIISPQANRQKRKENQHPIRQRRISFGELVQLDAFYP